MADTRYLVYVTEPNDHYASQSAAETAATALSEADHGSTYLVRGAVIETVATVSAAGVVTQTPVPNERWDNHLIGYHFDETSGTRASVGAGVVCNNDLEVTDDSIGFVSGLVGGNAADITFASAGGILRADTLDFRFGGGEGFPVTQDFTWIGWVFKNAAWHGDPKELIGAFTDNNILDWGIESDGGVSHFRFVDEASGAEEVALDMTATATWYFVSVVYTVSTKVARCALQATGFTDTAPLSTGLRAESTHFDVRAQSATISFHVDEHHFFTEAKTDAWVEEMYNEGAGRLFPYG